MNSIAHLSPLEVQVRLRHERMLLNRMEQRGIDFASFACIHCRAPRGRGARGRVEVRVLRNGHNKIIASFGECSTPGCLAWGDAL